MAAVNDFAAGVFGSRSSEIGHSGSLSRPIAILLLRVDAPARLHCYTADEWETRHMRNYFQPDDYDTPWADIGCFVVFVTGIGTVRVGFLMSVFRLLNVRCVPIAKA
jgi:hypothetical protein